MRTRIFNKMTAKEVDDYLARGGNTIFVAVGVVELHGALPIDAEQIMPEAYSVAMAEKADGLAMINLPYFFPGGTILGNCTVQVSVCESIDYLMMICRSLVAQGFRKIFFVSGHGPAQLYIDAACRDFFQESKIHACHINLVKLTMDEIIKNERGMQYFQDITVGAYSMMGQKQFLAVDPNAVDIPHMAPDPEQIELETVLQPFGGVCCLYYSHADQHGGGRAFLSEEERDESCARGEVYIREMVDKIDFEGLKNALDAYQKYVEEIIKNHPRLAGQY